MATVTDPSITRLPEHPCPECGYRLDAAGTTDGQPGSPSPGDCSVCMMCNTLLVYTDDLDLRRMTEVEWWALPGETRLELQFARAFVTYNFGRKN